MAREVCIIIDREPGRLLTRAVTTPGTCKDRNPKSWPISTVHTDPLTIGVVGGEWS